MAGGQIAITVTDGPVPMTQSLLVISTRLSTLMPRLTIADVSALDNATACGNQGDVRTEPLPAEMVAGDFHQQSERAVLPAHQEHQGGQPRVQPVERQHTSPTGSTAAQLSIPAAADSSTAAQDNCLTFPTACSLLCCCVQFKAHSILFEDSFTYNATMASFDVSSDSRLLVRRSYRQLTSPYDTTCGRVSMAPSLIFPYQWSGPEQHGR